MNYGRMIHHVDYIGHCPITMNLHITNKCNMRCGHCIYYGNDRADAYDPTDELSGARCCNIISQFSVSGGKAVELSGGEPTLHPEFKEITQFIQGEGIDWGVKTNGTHLDRIVGSPTWIRVSIDAATEDTYSTIHKYSDIDYILGSISNVVRKLYRTTVGASFLITPDNYREIADFALMMRPTGVDYIRYTFALLPGGSSIYNDIITEIKELCDEAVSMGTSSYDVIIEDYKLDAMRTVDRNYSRCYYSEQMVVVGADGYQYPCCELSYISKYRVQEVGGYCDFSHPPIDAGGCPPCDMDWKNMAMHNIINRMTDDGHHNFI